MDWVDCKDCVYFKENDCEDVEQKDGCYFGIVDDEPNKKGLVAFDIECFREYINSVIRGSYEVGIAYVETRPSFSKDEAIRRFQDKHWEDLKRLGIIKE